MAIPRRVDVVIIGGGHSGIAMSARLSAAGVDHVVLERGRAGDSWTARRWDSFTLLTPNWQTRLPGLSYDGDDPDGFMDRSQIAAFVARYATTVGAPIETGTTVTSVRPDDRGYTVETDLGPWSCRCVVVATGAGARCAVPAFADAIPDDIVQVDPLAYRNPDQLPEGGVLVVGAAATGVQLAEELQASGRPVLLSAGEHVRMPRRYRGRDIQHWMEAIGRLDERYDEVEDIHKARKVASPQLIGTPERRSTDLNHLIAAGVGVRGRLGAIRDGVALFSGGLQNHCALADQKLDRLLGDIDAWIDEHDAGDHVGPPERPEPTRIDGKPPLTLDLRSGQVRTVMWATGFRPDLAWLDLPVFDGSGRLRHDGGVVVDAPGVYYLGGTFLRRRRSSFIHGADADTGELAAHLVDHLARSTSP